MHALGPWRLIATANLLSLMLALAGCGRQPANVVDVRGTVTFDGQPVPLGMIIFEPDPSKGNRGPQGHAEIKAGQFDTRQSKQGAGIGPQIVRITGGDGVNPEPFTPLGKLLFDEYTTAVEVSKQPVELQFNVPSRVANRVAKEKAR